MKRISLSLVLCASFFIFGCKNENKDKENQETTENELNSAEERQQEKEGSKSITVNLEATSGSKLEGEVEFTEENGEVSMTATITGLSEGQHAIHLHEKADCSAADGSSAGGHWNPTYEKHGKWGDPEGYHKGDIGNFDVDAEGKGTISMSTDQWCIGCGEEDRDILGKAVVVHDGVDDFTSQPSGNAGSRVGCGEIQAQ